MYDQLIEINTTSSFNVNELINSVNSTDKFEFE